MTRLTLILAAALLARPAVAQDHQGKPAKEHEWLQQLAGEWTTEGEIAAQEKDKEPTKAKGSATSKMFGDFWLQIESRGEFEGKSFIGLLTIGWDGEKKKYVGTWIDTMQARLWHYTGAVEGKTLTLASEGPSFADPTKTSKYRDAIEIKGKDQFVLTSSVEQEGKWTTYLTVNYLRKK